MNAITLDHVSKRYRRAEAYRSFRDEISRRFRPGGLRRGTRDHVNALSDVSFEVPVGQAVALVGDNGAGKSTILKLVSRITSPTEGRVSVRGRTGALIEVGTGLHPELTGRENVMLYGRILGFSGQRIRSKFGEIVDFAGIGAAIDQPVKQYSSGMELRLGFAIAAHLEPDVLIVDEAIAVGDAAFQYRCVERMSRLVREGRTLLFVTHNLAAVEQLCDRALMLSQGRVILDADSRTVIHEYLHRVHSDLEARSDDRIIAGHGIEIREVSLHGNEGEQVSAIRPGDSLTVRIRFHASRELASPQFTIGITDPALGMLTMATMLIDGEDLGSVEGDGWIECTFESLPFKPRTYEIVGDVRQGFGRLTDLQRIARFRVEDENLLNGTGATVVSWSMKGAPVHVPYRWRYPNRDAGKPVLEEIGSTVD